MQKYTRSSSRCSSRAASSDSDAGDGNATMTVPPVTVPPVTVPEPIRRWHSFHSRRSSVSGAVPVVVVPVTTAQPSAAAADGAQAVRYLSPPPLTPRRRFSVWYY